MLLSAHVPHSGRDEEDCIETLEAVRTTRKAGAVDNIGGDINIDMKLGNMRTCTAPALSGTECTDRIAKVVARTSPLTRIKSDCCNC